MSSMPGSTWLPSMRMKPPTRSPTTHARAVRCGRVPHPEASAAATSCHAAAETGRRFVELTPLRFVASSPRGFGDLLARELTSFGAADVRERALGVEFTGTVETAYRVC